MMVKLHPKRLFCGFYLLRFRTLGVMSQFNYAEWRGKESLTQESRIIKTFIKYEKRIHQNSTWWSCCALKNYCVVFTYCPSGPEPYVLCLSLIVVSAEERNHLLKKVEQLKHSLSSKSAATNKLTRKYKKQC